MKIYRDVNVSVLRQPDLETVLGDDSWWLPYRGYGSFFGATFEDATACLAWERDLLERLSERTKRAEDQLVDAALDELEANDEPDPSWGLDLGVGSSVLALSAAGCATLVSCSGHFGEGRWITYPMVQFAADAQRVSILLEAAERADCGMADSAQGLVEVWAIAVDQMLDFAGCVIRRQVEFGSLLPAIVSRGDGDDEEAGPQIHPGQGSLFNGN